MELSSGQQRALFVVLVVALAGLGIYLIGPAGHHGAGAASSPSPSASSAPAPAASSAAAQSPAASATSAAAATSAGPVNIYNWLPFTQQDLSEAVHTTLAFATDYGTWSYTETATAYTDKMNGLVTGELAATLASSYATPGVAQQRAAQKQVSTSSGGIAQIRSFGTGSITFVVNIAQKLTTTKGVSTNTTQYAITCVPGPGSWQVNDIELASAGNS